MYLSYCLPKILRQVRNRYKNGGCTFKLKIIFLSWQSCGNCKRISSAHFLKETFSAGFCFSIYLNPLIPNKKKFFLNGFWFISNVFLQILSLGTNSIFDICSSILYLCASQLWIILHYCSLRQKQYATVTTRKKL